MENHFKALSIGSDQTDYNVITTHTHYVYGPCLRDRNLWSFDMFFAQESFKNALFLMILVCMDRAQSEELGTLHFCRCQMYIS